MWRKIADVVMYIYVLDAKGVLLGVIDIRELLQAEPTEKLEDIMVTNIVSLDENATVAEASKLFARYSFRAIPIVGEGDSHEGRHSLSRHHAIGTSFRVTDDGEFSKLI